MISRIEDLRREAETALAAAASEREVDELRVRFLGRKSEFTALQKKLGELPGEDRPAAGRAVNEAKTRISTMIEEALQRLKREARAAARATSAVDVSLPGRRPPWGTLHPLTRVRQEIVQIFARMGFRVETGPEVETDFFNFQALGIPKDHPARDMQDTFYVSDDVVLRTHTSPVQIRSMLAHEQAPVRILGIGAVYRRDSDISHSPMFHQVEGLMVEEGISFAHLKGILGAFAREMFGKKTRTRFRPSYFPFTEPSAEVDITCFLCNGKGCRTCGGTGWIEILGSGMVDPVVFEEVQRYAAENGIESHFDPEKVQGFAFGMGIERIAMLKYRIADIRLFFDNDVRFLRQFRGEVG